MTTDPHKPITRVCLKCNLKFISKQGARICSRCTDLNRRGGPFKPLKVLIDVGRPRK